jgi:hypothetical protein
MLKEHGASTYPQCNAVHCNANYFLLMLQLLEDKSSAVSWNVLLCPDVYLIVYFLGILSLTVSGNSNFNHFKKFKT